MKARRVVTIVWAVGLILAIAAPAGAKGVDAVTLSGGGIEVTFVGFGEPNTNTKLAKLAESARFYEALWADAPESNSPTGDLGPRITAEWRFPVGAPTMIVQYPVIIQYLYLDAEGGPVGHIPGGQELYGDVYPESWFLLAPEIAEHLAAVGFDVTTLDSTATSDTISPGALPWLFAFVVAVGAALAFSGIMGRRRIRRMV